MDIIEKENGITVIDGTYNASVDSMKSSLDILANYQRRKVAILADMLELGDYSESLHREVGQYAVDKNIDVLVCVGKESHYLYEQALCGIKQCYYFENNELLSHALHDILQDHDVVLVKGSHSMNLKEIVEKI